MDRHPDISRLLLIKVKAPYVVAADSSLSFLAGHPWLAVLPSAGGNEQKLFHRLIAENACTQTFFGNSSMKQF